MNRGTEGADARRYSRQYQQRLPRRLGGTESVLRFTMADPLDTLDSVNASIDDLEATLDALFSNTLAETEENLLPEQKAKLQVTLSYVIQDLVLSELRPSLYVQLRGSDSRGYEVFLKTKGLDPSKHPVSEELKRVKTYFDKIKEAEDPARRMSPSLLLIQYCICFSNPLSLLSAYRYFDRGSRGGE